MTKTAEDFYKEYPQYKRKPKEGKPVLDLALWGLFPYTGYEMAFGIMASEGHPYIFKGEQVSHTSVIIDKTIEEDGTVVCETHNSVYRLVGKSLEDCMKESMSKSTVEA